MKTFQTIGDISQQPDALEFKKLKIEKILSTECVASLFPGKFTNLLRVKK